MAAPSPSDRLLEILAAKIAEETGLDPALAREVAPAALASDSVDEGEPIALRDARGHVVARIPFSLVEEAFDDLDDEEDGER
ncbi:MAG TPA: hypothetical protein PLP50_01010 [Thermoanaerobaculia bacterium]|nr:hypothetical protein [Thermoanaerobaculia bacterium]HQN07712.1 hypothetical protein [Thermoanaerobaculia bacterium]HQP85095.1 hypothetical protein [Thermoanaerobaculia bacterium]